MLSDLRHAVRMLRQAKGWTAVVLVSLALGIGANTALFSVINGLLLRTIPVREPESLVRFRWHGPNDMLNNHSSYGFTRPTADGRDTSASFSYRMYRQFVESNETLEAIAAGAPFGQVNVVVDGEAELARAYMSSGNFYRVLGVSAVAGRVLDEHDDRAGAAPAAVIGEQYWRARFAGDRGIVGRTVRVGGTPVTIVGVVPAAFTGIQLPLAEAPHIGLPLALHDALQTGQGPIPDPTTWWLNLIGRLKPGATPAHVQANLERVFQHTARAGLDEHLASLTSEQRALAGNQNRTRIPGLTVEPGAQGVYDTGDTQIRSATMVSAVVGLVLLIVCANVANLLLSRAATRQKEISVRLSIGATRLRLVRQMLTESLLIAVLGGAAGTVLAYWGRTLLPPTLGRPSPFDATVLLFSLGVTCATGLLFGLAPALGVTRVSLNTSLKAHARGVVSSRHVLGRGLLITQVALTLLLLIGSALFLRTIHNLRSVNVGFNPENVALFSINPLVNGYDTARRAAFFGDLLREIRGVPGVRAVALSQPSLFSGTNTTRIFVQGRTYDRNARTFDTIHRMVVSPDFFTTMEIPLAAGRGLTERDTPTSPAVIVINEAAARKYFADVNPIGQRIGPSIETAGQLEIVGVVRDASYNSLRDAVPPTMYHSYLQRPVGTATFEVRTAGDPSTVLGPIRELVRRLDATLPVTSTTTQMEQIASRHQQERVFAQAYTLFGGIALVLASIGLFGLMSYAVARRTNEIGIRMALGAQPRGVLALVLAESAWLVAIGIALGLGGVLAAGRFVRAFLFGVPPTDALSIASGVVVTLAVCALAAYVPARRASRVSPLVALRIE